MSSVIDIVQGFQQANSKNLGQVVTNENSHSFWKKNRNQIICVLMESKQEGKKH